MEHETRGPMMLAATSVLKQAPARVSRLGAGIQLPRTVPVKTLVVCLLSGLFMIGLSGVFLGYQLRSILVSGVLGGGAGWFVVTYQPLEGETFLKWLGLEFFALKDRRARIDGRRAQAYVGICPITQTARGKIIIAHGHANVAPGSVDERGGVVPVSSRSVGLLHELGRRNVGETTEE